MHPNVADKVSHSTAACVSLHVADTAGVSLHVDDSVVAGRRNINSRYSGRHSLRKSSV